MKEAREIIKKLKERYEKDPEALELIENAVKDIEYIEKKEAAGGYTGQTAVGKAKELEAFLHDWY